MRWVLLPGMDGTARLFDGLVDVLGEPSTRVAYDPATPVAYEALHPALPDEDGLILLGESFSGPVAIRLAKDPRVQGLVLCASFARLPYPAAVLTLGRVLATIVPPRPPRLAIRTFLVGRQAPVVLVDEVAAAIASVRPAVFRQRLRDVLAVDVRAAFSALRVPILYLRAERDRLVPKAAAAELEALQRTLRVTVLEGAPHLLLQTQPNAAARALRAFSRTL